MIMNPSVEKPISEHKNGLLVIISGPSGAGKTTITHAVEKKVGAVFSVSMTTRPQTAADVEGQDYFFVSENSFREAIAQDQLLEWAEVYAGRFYGSPRKWVSEQLQAGKLVILEIDVDGAKQVKAKMPEAFSIFIEPPSEEVLLQRLRARAREDESVIQERFAKAKAEIAAAHASGVYDQFLINDVLEFSIQTASEWIAARRAQVSGG